MSSKGKAVLSSAAPPSALSINSIKEYLRAKTPKDVIYETLVASLESSEKVAQAKLIRETIDQAERELAVESGVVFIKPTAPPPVASGAAGRPSAPSSLPVSSAASAAASGAAFSEPRRGAPYNPADIQITPGNGWCLYNSILFAFGLGYHITHDNSAAQLLACAISKWLLAPRARHAIRENFDLNKVGDGDPIFVERTMLLQDAEGNYTTEPVDVYTNRRGFITQHPAAPGDAEYARLKDGAALRDNISIYRRDPYLRAAKRKFFESFEDYANGLNTLRDAGNLENGPLIWPDFQLISPALKRMEPFRKYNFKVFFERGGIYQPAFAFDENDLPPIYIYFSGGAHYDPFKFQSPRPAEGRLVESNLAALCYPAVGGRRKSIKKRHAKRKTQKRR